MTNYDRDQVETKVFFEEQQSAATPRPADWLFLQPSVMDEMHDAVIVTDMQGVITGCNRAAQGIFGWTSEEMIGRGVTTLYSEEDRCVFTDTIVPALEKTGSFRGEVRNLTHSGDYIFVHLAMTLLRDGEGRPAGMAGFSVDVTGQKLGALAVRRNAEMEREREGQRALAASIKMLAKAVDLAQDVVMITEAEPVNEPGPCVVYVNPAFEKMTGYKAADVVGKSPRILHGPKTERAALDRIHAALKEWKPVREQLVNYRKDGREFWVELSIFPMANESGWFTHWVSVQRDITEQNFLHNQMQEGEREAKRRELELMKAQRMARLGAWSLDIETQAVTWSEEIFRFFGLDPLEKAPSLELQQKLFKPQSWKRLQAAMRRTIEEGKPFELDLEFESPDATQKWVTARGEVQSFIDGRPAALCGTMQDMTERKTAEQRVREAHEKLENVLSNMTDGLQILDRDWRYTYVNEQAEKLLGLGAEKLLGGRVWDLYPAADGTKFYEGYHRAVETGEPVNFEEFYPEPLNKWLECHCYPSDSGLSVYFRDITERKEYEARLQEKRERLSLGMEVAALALAEVDYATGMNHLSDEAARMFGIGQSAVTVPREAVHSTVHPEDREALAERIAGSLDPKGLGWFAMDHRVVWPSGEVRWLRVRKKIFFEGEGEERKPARAMLAAFDVTVEKNATEEIRRSEERFRMMAESLPQLVWTADGSGRKLYCNQEYLRYAGVESPEMMDVRWAQILHPEDRQGTVETWQRSIATGEPYLREYRLRRYDGEYRHFIARALPVRTEGGMVERWLGSLTDIHDQKKTEEALRRSEMLAAAGRLAASVAHEINNPLESVTNLLYLLRTNPSLDAVGQAYVTTAEEELARVSEITTQTLRFHRQSTMAAPTNMAEVLESVLALYRSRIEAAGLVLVREYKAAPLLTCLAGDVRHAVANLIGNAIDATPRDGRLRVRVRQTVDWTTRESAGVRITIGDTGRGIDAESRKRIFEAFYSTKGITNTGLGLWITKDLVARCGGTISLRSSVRAQHMGTVFSIHLPFLAV